MRAEDLDLFYLPMEEAAFAADPFFYLVAARKRHPWLARCAFGYVVHQYQAMHDLMWVEGKMSTGYDTVVDAMAAHDTRWGAWTARHLAASMGGVHKRLREVLAPSFTPRRANESRPLMRKVISEVLQEWAPRGKFDFEEAASYFPITVMCTMIGAPASAVPELRQSLEALGLSASMKRDHLPALEAAFVQVEDFSQALVAARRGGARLRPERDMLDDLIAATDSGGMSDRELYDLLVFLFVAGYDTSKNVLTYTMNALMARPEIYERCGRDWEYAGKLTEETLRFFNPGTIPRLTSQPISYEGVTIPAGVGLFFPVSVAGRDPTVIENPNALDPERVQVHRHMAFGRGPHICLGQFVARATIHEGLHLIPQWILSPRRAGPSEWRPFFGVWGIRGLPIECTSVKSAGETTADADAAVYQDRIMQ